MCSSARVSEAFQSQRRCNLVIFCFMFFAVGLESVLTISTLWAYLETLVHPDNSHVWYGLITCSYHIMDAASGMVLSQYVDRTRNIPYRTKFRRTKFSSDKIFRRTKFSTLSRNFDNFV